MKEADTNGTERKAETDFEGTIRNRDDAEIIKEARALQGIDLGIFVNPYEKDEVKSA